MRKLALLLSLVQTSCGIGGYWMNGDPFYKPDIKPYIAYWQKDAMTDEGRLKDWERCGGHKDGSFSWKVKEQLPLESEDQTRTRQAFDFQRCMIRAGYHYTGNCASDYMKSRPLCGAP